MPVVANKFIFFFYVLVKSMSSRLLVLVLYIRLVPLLSFSVSLWDLLPFWVVALVWVCSLSQKGFVHCKCSAGVLVIGVKTRRIHRRRHTTTIISCCK